MLEEIATQLARMGIDPIDLVFLVPRLIVGTFILQLTAISCGFGYVIMALSWREKSHRVLGTIAGLALTIGMVIIFTIPAISFMWYHHIELWNGDVMLFHYQMETGHRLIYQIAGYGLDIPMSGHRPQYQYAMGKPLIVQVTDLIRYLTVYATILVLWAAWDLRGKNHSSRPLLVAA